MRQSVLPRWRCNRRIRRLGVLVVPDAHRFAKVFPHSHDEIERADDAKQPMQVVVAEVLD
jgi:hypothetical protein